ncbi:hypothetical protein PHO31112_04726 [Pandoraea horticolens]|uniref:Protein kinase domain-containing protein n=2 Tax=Pandoraea horticolens TaxID=2508298 RepID=A0A5E4YRY6_9BURK|nr:hypothetical protein PHO31112_04726 [Pandoraea horticolens]
MRIEAAIVNRNRDDTPANQMTPCIWPIEGESIHFEYEKAALLGEGGQKCCWKITSRDVAGDFVLLEYRYPSSLHDDRFLEYDDCDKEYAYHQAHEVAEINSDKEITILKRLRGLVGALQLQRVIQCKGNDFRPQIHAIVDFHNRGNLKEFSTQNISLSTREKLGMAIDMMKGLCSIIDNKIYLTDIKAENILLDDTSGRLTATICDFCNADILEDFTIDDKKHNLECLLDIIRRDIFKANYNCDVDNIIQYDRNAEDICLRDFLYKLVGALNNVA